MYVICRSWSPPSSRPSSTTSRASSPTAPSHCVPPMYRYLAPRRACAPSREADTRRGGNAHPRGVVQFRMKSPISHILITIGGALIVVGLLWPLLQKAGLGRLPGDIVVKNENFSFYYPLATSIIVSLVLTLLFWFFRR